MAIASWDSRIVVTGDSTAFTGLSLSQVSGQEYRVSASDAKAIWDPDTAPTIKDNGVAVDAADIESIDYLFGKVTFDAGYAVTGPVTADGSYLPRATVSTAFSFRVGRSRNLLDDTKFGDNAMKRAAGLKDVSVEIEAREDSADAISMAVGSDQTLEGYLNDGGAVVIDISIGDATNESPTHRRRIYCVADEVEVAGETDGQVITRFSAQGHAGSPGDGLSSGPHHSID